MKKMTIEDKLGLNLFHTDEENSHYQSNKVLVATHISPDGVDFAHNVPNFLQR